MKTKTQYSIRTLTPASGFSAVWSHDHGGKIEIEVRPLDFIAVATVQRHQHGKWIDDDWDIVGIELGDGFFQLVTDSENCHGIVRDGASFAECLDLLPSELKSRVVEPEGNTDQERNRWKGGMLNV